MRVIQYIHWLWGSSLTPYYYSLTRRALTHATVNSLLEDHAALRLHLPVWLRDNTASVISSTNHTTALVLSEAQSATGYAGQHVTVAVPGLQFVV